MTFIRQFISLILLASCLMAQEVDQQSSLAIVLKKDLPRGFDLDFLHDLRSKEDNSTLKKSITELGLTYKLTKYLRLGTAYRYSIYPDKFSERGSAHVLLSFKTGPLTHRARLKFQRDEASDALSQDYLRYRYTLRHKRIYGYRPFIDLENFRHLEESEDEKRRLDIGFNKKLNKRTNLELYYRFQEELNVKNPKSVRLLGLKFVIEI